MPLTWLAADVRAISVFDCRGRYVDGSAGVNVDVNVAVDAATFCPYYPCRI